MFVLFRAVSSADISTDCGAQPSCNQVERADIRSIMFLGGSEYVEESVPLIKRGRFSRRRIRQRRRRSTTTTETYYTVNTSTYTSTESTDISDITTVSKIVGSSMGDYCMSTAKALPSELSLTDVYTSIEDASSNIPNNLLDTASSTANLQLETPLSWTLTLQSTLSATMAAETQHSLGENLQESSSYRSGIFESHSSSLSASSSFESLGEQTSEDSTFLYVELKSSNSQASIFEALSSIEISAIEGETTIEIESAITSVTIFDDLAFQTSLTDVEIDSSILSGDFSAEIDSDMANETVYLTTVVETKTDSGAFTSEPTSANDADSAVDSTNAGVTASLEQYSSESIATGLAKFSAIISEASSLGLDISAEQSNSAGDSTSLSHPPNGTADLSFLEEASSLEVTAFAEATTFAFDSFFLGSALAASSSDIITTTVDASSVVSNLDGLITFELQTASEVGVHDSAFETATGDVSTFAESVEYSEKSAAEDESTSEIHSLIASESTISDSAWETSIYDHTTLSGKSSGDLTIDMETTVVESALASDIISLPALQSSIYDEVTSSWSRLEGETTIDFGSLYSSETTSFDSPLKTSLLDQEITSSEITKQPTFVADTSIAIESVSLSEATSNDSTMETSLIDEKTTSLVDENTEGRTFAAETSSDIESATEIETSNLWDAMQTSSIGGTTTSNMFESPHESNVDSESTIDFEAMNTSVLITNLVYSLLPTSVGHTFSKSAVSTGVTQTGISPAFSTSDTKLLSITNDIQFSSSSDNSLFTSAIENSVNMPGTISNEMRESTASFTLPAESSTSIIAANTFIANNDYSWLITIQIPLLNPVPTTSAYMANIGAMLSSIISPATESDIFIATNHEAWGDQPSSVWATASHGGEVFNAMPTASKVSEAEFHTLTTSGDGNFVNVISTESMESDGIFSLSTSANALPTASKESEAVFIGIATTSRDGQELIVIPTESSGSVDVVSFSSTSGDGHVSSFIPTESMEIVTTATSTVSEVMQVSIKSIETTKSDVLSDIATSEAPEQSSYSRKHTIELGFSTSGGQVLSDFIYVSSETLSTATFYSLDMMITTSELLDSTSAAELSYLYIASKSTEVISYSSNDVDPASSLTISDPILPSMTETDSDSNTAFTSNSRSVEATVIPSNDDASFSVNFFTLSGSALHLTSDDATYTSGVLTSDQTLDRSDMFAGTDYEAIAAINTLTSSSIDTFAGTDYVNTAAIYTMISSASVSESTFDIESMTFGESMLMDSALETSINDQDKSSFPQQSAKESTFKGEFASVSISAIASKSTFDPAMESSINSDITTDGLEKSAGISNMDGRSLIEIVVTSLVHIGLVFSSSQEVADATQTEYLKPEASSISHHLPSSDAALLSPAKTTDEPLTEYPDIIPAATNMLPSPSPLLVDQEGGSEVDSRQNANVPRPAQTDIRPARGPKQDGIIGKIGFPLNQNRDSASSPDAGQNSNNGIKPSASQPQNQGVSKFLDSNQPATPGNDNKNSDLKGSDNGMFLLTQFPAILCPPY